MASAQVVETSVTNNSPSQDSYHPDDLFQSRWTLHVVYLNLELIPKFVCKRKSKIDPTQGSTYDHMTLKWLDCHIPPKKSFFQCLPHFSSLWLFAPEIMHHSIPAASCPPSPRETAGLMPVRSVPRLGLSLI